MRILFDQGVPQPLRSMLADHLVETAGERGWSTLENGELLGAAEEAGFELLITTDKRLRFQQSMASRRIAVLVLPTTSWLRLRGMAPTLQQALGKCVPGLIVDMPEG